MPQTYYRFEANVIGRSSGKQSSRSVVFASAYRAGEKLSFEREGVEADYTGKRGILETGILAPKGAPPWMCDRERLWNEVEAVEKRKDAQLARELLIAFPDELSTEQRREALMEFLVSQIVDKGMVADYAIHAPGKGGDERNHHAHVLLTMRGIEEERFGNKRREWNSPDVLRSWREEWANALNRTFERHGITDDQGEKYRVDHRSYEEQGIEREPGVHLGPAVTALERRGVSTERGDANREIYGRNAEIQMLRRQAQEIGNEVLKLRAELRMPNRRQAHRSLRFIEDSENVRHAENDNDFDLSL